jgi:hypothetical protein
MDVIDYSLHLPDRGEQKRLRIKQKKINKRRAKRAKAHAKAKAESKPSKPKPSRPGGAGAKARVATDQLQIHRATADPPVRIGRSPALGRQFSNLLISSRRVPDAPSRRPPTRGENSDNGRPAHSTRPTAHSSHSDPTTGTRPTSSMRSTIWKTVNGKQVPLDYISEEAENVDESENWEFAE